MRIGYACLNWTIGCTPASRFRLANLTSDRLREAIDDNLECLQKILEFNLQKGVFFFRISSDTIPFASHPDCPIDWESEYKKKLSDIGKYIKKYGFRVSMHPDQFVVLTSTDEKIVDNSIRELDYHARFLDAMGLDDDAKIQIHVGGVYGEKPEAMRRFIVNYRKLPENVLRRLIIENDDRSYSLKDCLDINDRTDVPIIFDAFHHSILNNGEPLKDAALLAQNTWKKHDGKLIIDYSTQLRDERIGAHTNHIDIVHFKKFLKDIKGIDADIMLEIKDKEKSAIEALKVVD